MLSRNFLKAAILTTLMLSPAAKAVDLFGYYTFDYSEVMTGDTGKTPKQSGATGKAGNFDIQFLSLMIQHEQGIYKFFAEMEFMFGSEVLIGTNNTQLDGSWGSGAGIIVERAYTDAAYSPMFNVRLGKSLAPILWKSNHYPNIVKPITEPQAILQKVLQTGYIGPQIFGKLGGGFNYNVWSGRSGADQTNTNNQAYSKWLRLGYEKDWSGGNMEISLVGGQLETGFANTLPTASTADTLTPSGLDFALNMGKFTFWYEYADSGEESATGSSTGVSNTNKKSKNSSFAVLSYAMDIKGKEFTPFLYMDNYSNSFDGTNFANTAIGANYRVTPTVEHKVEYSSVAQSNTAKSVVNEARLKYQFVYFFN